MNLTDEQFNSIFPKETPRKFQREIIDHIISAFDSGKKYVILEAPTGIGKSAIAIAVSKYFANSYILVNQKTLQDQYFNDYKQVGLKTVKGRSNYTCRKNDELTCEAGICTRVTKKNFSCTGCPYTEARNSAYLSPLTVLNYSYFFTMSKGKDNPYQTKRELLVTDEAHNVELELLKFVDCTFDRVEFKRHNLGQFLHFPKETDSLENKLKWLSTTAKKEVQSRFNDTCQQLENMEENDKGHNKLKHANMYLDSLLSSISRILELFKTGVPAVVVHENVFKITFKALYAKSFTQDYLFKFADKNLMMSATILDYEQYCKDLGINKDDVAFIRCPSLFPVENHPIYPLNVGKMNYASIEDNKYKIVDAIKKILLKHKNEKGIIGVTSYKLAEFIVDKLDDPRVILPKGKDRNRDINDFLLEHVGNDVLISPSIYEGLDCYDNISRFCIIIKIPYGNLGDPFTKARMEYDNKWYSVDTLRRLIQLTGRSIRSEKDYAATYILDSGFNYFIASNIKSVPKWWKDAIQKEPLK